MSKSRKKYEQPIISREEIARMVVESLDNQGIEIKNGVSQIITKEFLKAIQYYLQKGYKIQLDSIGDLCPTYRKVRTTKETVVETSKVTVELTDKMKSTLDSKLQKDNTYRTYLEKARKY